MRQGSELLLRTVLIGHGDPARGDAAAGLLVVRALEERLPEDIRAIEVTDGRVLAETWAGFDLVILVDAMRSGAPPGTVHRFEGRVLLGQDALRAFSAHGVGLETVLTLASRRGDLPPELIVVGIEGREFDAGAAVSPTVRAAVPGAVRAVLEELGRCVKA